MPTFHSEYKLTMAIRVLTSEVVDSDILSGEAEESPSTSTFFCLVSLLSVVGSAGVVVERRRIYENQHRILADTNTIYDITHTQCTMLANRVTYAVSYSRGYVAGYQCH